MDPSRPEGAGALECHAGGSHAREAARCSSHARFVPRSLLVACLVCLMGQSQVVCGSLGWPDVPMDLSLARPSSSLTGAKSANIARTKSRVWFDGYKAGCMQFLHDYVPEQFDGKPLVIGVAGGSGSGKTTIKDVIVEQLSKDSCAVLPHDNYYRHRPDLTDEERDRINFDHPESLETELMVEHLKKLINGEAVDIPVYDFATHLRRSNETLRIEPKPVIIVEGILILHDQSLLRLMNLRVFVDVEADRRLIRRIDRDMVERGRSFASIVHQYLSTVKPMHDLFVEPSKGSADIIIPFGGRNIAAIQVLLERLKTHIRHNQAFILDKGNSTTQERFLRRVQSGELNYRAEIEDDSSSRPSPQREISIPVLDELEKFKPDVDASIHFASLPNNAPKSNIGPNHRPTTSHAVL